MDAKRSRAPGAGRKVRDGQVDTRRHEVMLDAASAAVLIAVGGGNLSLGVREATRRIVESGDTAPFSEARHSLRADRSKG